MNSVLYDIIIFPLEIKELVLDLITNPVYYNPILLVKDFNLAGDIKTNMTFMRMQMFLLLQFMI
jgi:hypothetical protein